MLIYLDTLIGFAALMLVLSLLITIVTQAVSALVNHRGSNLLWGIKTLFANIDSRRYPNLSREAESVAHAVLTHCLISDSWFSDNKVALWLADRVPLLKKLFTRFQIASAIRPAELRDILRLLSDDKLADPDVARDIRLLLGLSPVAAMVADAAGARLTHTVAEAEQILANAEAVVALQTAKLESWFNVMMDRVSQKFAMYMRIWTVAFASMIAFGTGLNSVRLLSDLYSNGAFRNALVGAGQQAMTSAGKVLDAKNSLAAKYSQVLQQALEETHVSLPAPPPPMATPADVAQWISRNVPADRQAEVRRRFDTASAAASQLFIQGSIEDASRVSAIASSSGFDALENRWPKSPGIADILGVLLTTGLLSLGAPFWFNALKSLTNLRTVVAAKEASEQKQSAA